MKLKNLIVAFALALTASAATAQTDGFAYQAVVRNAQGELVSNSDVKLRLTLNAADGTVLYQETQKAKTNAYGVLSVTVGTGTAVNGTFADVDWSKNISMKVEIDTKGGTNFTDLGTTKLQAVPYAYYAANTANSGGSMQVQGTKGQTLVHDGTNWVATDEIAVKKLDVKASENTEEALFEVKDKEGNVVFAVYPNAVRVYPQPYRKGTKSSGKILGKALCRRSISYNK